MSDRLLRMELDRLFALWPGLDALDVGTKGQDAAEALADALKELEDEERRLEDELDDVQNQMNAIRAALGQHSDPPRWRVTWRQVDDQLAIVTALYAQYGVPLPEHVERAVAVRAAAATATATPDQPSLLTEATP